MAMEWRRSPAYAGGAIGDGSIAIERVHVGGDGNDVSGWVDDEIEAAGGHVEGANVALNEGDVGMVGEVRDARRGECAGWRESTVAVAFSARA